MTVYLLLQTPNHLFDVDLIVRGCSFRPCWGRKCNVAAITGWPGVDMFWIEAVPVHSELKVDDEVSVLEATDQSGLRIAESGPKLRQ